ncbi:signal transduction histidine kinase [Streptomyces puniciscabiei]|uniref:histidine kinase n=1 Tax=Streptomyces puniciscabiei TaxID=164348 RepID=A0A542THJ3_9ACTN|nr:sensor histidine kinase [Streptomyces puniciscabiei]TQK86296.1 signal transduction histidine kinase [Streptomyces puniciscabiei]
MQRLHSLAAAGFSPPALAALLYSALAFPLAIAGSWLTLAGLAFGCLLSVTPLGVWLLAGTVRAALALGALQRALARGLLGLEIEPPLPSAARGPLAWRRTVLGNRTGWKAVGCALLAPFTAVLAYIAAAIGYVYGALFTLHPLIEHVDYHTVHHPDGSITHVSLQVLGFQVDSWPRWLIPVTAGLLLLVAAPHLVRHALAPHRALLAALLGPDAAERRIRTLEETRAQAVDDAAATLRRIERDLHDGTQARLVSLGMHLTVIRELVTMGADRERVLAAVDTARSGATQAIADLRHLVKGIHPPVLDEGLEAALATLAADSALPVTLCTGITIRPSPALETIIYFCAAELLANATKHSGADEVRLTVTAADGRLRLSVTDDGRGGATVGAGSGLTGLLARIRTVDGTLTCDSPPGGPTVVTVELPL